MKSFNVISGLPRSGSTLLCNILNQNPDFYAGSTSPLPELVGAFVNTCSHSQEVISCLAHDSDKTTKRLQNMVSAIIDEWYGDLADDKIVFDKSRGWPFSSLLLQHLFKNVKMIICVRDLRSIFGSIEKQHRKNPIFDHALTPGQKTILGRADTMMSPDGLIGQPVIGVEDVMARTPENVYILKYEAFTVDPATSIKEIYNFLGIDHFIHNYEDVKSTAEDTDAIYLNKFPHEGSGKVMPTNKLEWKDYVTDDLAKLIQERYPSYNQRFGYA